MNWGIYEKRKKLIIWAFVINVSIVLIAALVLPAIGKTRCNRSPFTKDKSYLKQIGTTVAMYFSDGYTNKFPQHPRDIEFDNVIVHNAVQDTWFDLSYTSPYYFFPEEDSIYTGSSWRPLAVRKTPLKNYNLCPIVYQDGHVETISPKLASALILFSKTYKLIKESLNLR